MISGVAISEYATPCARRIDRHRARSTIAPAACDFAFEDARDPCPAIFSRTVTVART